MYKGRIAMATPPRTGLTRVFMESVAERLLRCTADNIG